MALLSPDGRHAAFVALRSGKRLVVVDGAGGAEYDEIARGGPLLSEDGRHFAYLAKDSRGTVLVIDGRTTPALGRIISGSLADRSWRHSAYATLQGGRALVVHDGVAGREAGRCRHADPESGSAHGSRSG